MCVFSTSACLHLDKTRMRGGKRKEPVVRTSTSSERILYNVTNSLTLRRGHVQV